MRRTTSPRLIFLTAAAFLILTAEAAAQESPAAAKSGDGAAASGEERRAQSACVESWRLGGTRVVEQEFRVTLTPAQREHAADVPSASGLGSYRLLFRYNPARAVKLDYWQVEMREVLPGDGGAGESLGPNLLTLEGTGPGGDNFPREDLVGYLYPKPDPSVFKGDGLAFYPVDAKRVVKVEGFFLVLRVEGYQLNARQPATLDSLSLHVRLTNGYEESDCAGEFARREALRRRRK